MWFFSFLFKLLGALVAVALTFFIIFLMNPSWQKGVVETALKQDTSRQWQVGEVMLNPVHVSMVDLYMLEGAMGAGIRDIQLRGPFWMAPMTGRIEVESGILDELSMDLSRIPVGNLTSEDWQSFLSTVSTDISFWEERVDLVLQKLAAGGWDYVIKDVIVAGAILLPGQSLIPVRFRILEADSREPGHVRIEALDRPERMEL